MQLVAFPSPLSDYLPSIIMIAVQRAMLRLMAVTLIGWILLATVGFASG
jgi:hypothetical protein